MTSPSVAARHPRVSAVDSSEARFVAHLRSHASRYVPGLRVQQTTVRTVQHIIRKHSSLLEFEVTDGTLRKNVICKIPFSLQDTGNHEPLVEDRPRLFPTSEAVSIGQREYLGLESIAQHFSALNDDRFGAIAVLELLESPFVVVMEKSEDRSLKSLLKKSTRFHCLTRNVSRLQAAFRNAGAWLREFHAMPALPHTKERHSDRACYIDSVLRFTDALILKLNHKLYFRDVRQQLESAAMRILPREVPCATVHGDFAPRNILIGTNSRVTVIDTQRRWIAPVYEDLAYLLMSVKLSRLQVSSQGLIFSRRQLAIWESDLLIGYFASSAIPLAAVRLYEVLLSLEWWTAISFRSAGDSGFKRLGNGLCNRYLFRYVEGLLKDLKNPLPASESPHSFLH